MFSSDAGYDNDDELSGDDGRRSPRGAAGYGTRAADAAERRIASGKEPMDFGGRRRGDRMPFGGNAFGVAPKQRDVEIDMDELDVGRPKEKVTVLQDFSARLWRNDGPPASAVNEDVARKREAKEADELALLSGKRKSHAKEQVELSVLTGKRSAKDSEFASKQSAGDSGTSTSSSSSGKKKKKKKKQRKHDKKAKKAKKTNKDKKHKSKKKKAKGSDDSP